MLSSSAIFSCTGDAGEKRVAGVEGLVCGLFLVGTIHFCSELNRVRRAFPPCLTGAERGLGWHMVDVELLISGVEGGVGLLGMTQGFWLVELCLVGMSD